MEYYKNTEINDLPGETWRVAPTFNRYEVSNLGRIAVIQKGVKKILRQCFNQAYLVVGLTNDENKRKTVRVHRIVADTFLSKQKTDEILEVNHKDRVKTNNQVDNLEWSTHRNNCQHMFATGQRIIKVTPEIVRHVRSLKETGIQQQEIASSLNLSNSTISEILSGKKWHYI